MIVFGAWQDSHASVAPRRGVRATAGAVALAALWITAGCYPSAGKKPLPEPVRAPASGPAVPVQAWAVRLGSEGGFTGGSSGYEIRSDATVWSWSQVAPGDTTTNESRGRATPESIRSLHDALVAQDLVGVQFQSRGNMTTFLQWSEGTRLAQWSWPEQATPAKLPSALHRVYVAARNAIASAQHP